MARLLVAPFVLLAASVAAQAQTGFWGPPVNVGPPVNTPANELSGSVADSGRTLYFVRTEAGQNDLYVSHREGNTWSRPIFLSILNTAAHNEVNPTLTADGERIFFASDRPAGYGGFDIWSSSRSGAGWDTPALLGTAVNSASDEWFAAPGPDGLYLAARTAPGANRGDILFAAGVYPGYAARAPIPALATAAREMSVFPDPEGSVLYVTSDRSGSAGLDDLWSSTREGQTWGDPTPLPCGVNGPDYEQYATCVHGAMEMLFASYRRPDGYGGSDLYVSSWHALGDANGDGRASMADIIHLVNYLFVGGAPPQDPWVEDPDCDGEIGVLDVVLLANYILRGGTAPCVSCE